jgi:hypothetical protein
LCGVDARYEKKRLMMREREREREREKKGGKEENREKKNH